MKKLFLLFGMATFASASAQPGDFFDVELHLQKKSKQKQSKKLLVLSIPKTKNFILPKFDQENFSGPSLMSPGNYYLLPNGNKVYTLSQDHMPCIVPDMKQWNTMPNPAFNGTSHPYHSSNEIELRKIPNAWKRPPVLIPE